MKKQIGIEGMSCGHCVRHVEEALKEIDGVSNVQVSLQDKNAVIDVNDTVSDAKLREIIEEVGYDVTGINNL